VKNGVFVENQFSMVSLDN